MKSLYLDNTGEDMATRARQSVELLRNLKVPVTFREYDCGHEVTADGVRDLSKFLIEKVAEPIIRV